MLPVSLSKRIKVSGLLLLAVWLISTGIPLAGEAGPLVAVLLPPGTGDISLIRSGMEDAARHAGVRLWSSRAASLEEEARLLATAIRRRPAVLVVTPLSPEGSAAKLHEARAAGMHVICFAACVNEPGIASAVIDGPDRDAAALSADEVMAWVIRRHAGRATVGIWPCPQDVGCRACRASLIARLKQMPGIEIIEMEAQPGHSPAELLQAYPQASLLWAASAEGILHATQAVRALGLAGQVVVFGSGLDRSVADLLQADGDILQSVAVPLPYQAGYYVVNAAAGLARSLGTGDGRAFPANAVIINSSNIDLAHTYLAHDGRWLLPPSASSAPGKRLFETSPTPPICRSCEPSAHPAIPTP